MNYPQYPTRPRPPKGFTLIELLVVIAVIALLVSLILPALGKARQAGRSTVCLNGTRQLGMAFVTYNNDHKERVIPSFNTTGVNGDAPLDGWAPILDRDGYVTASQQVAKGAFYCPDTFDIAGVREGQTGTDLINPRGWLDWPFIRTGSSNESVTIPERGFEKVIRVSYWLNAINPIGGTVVVEQDLHYTGSVGYGPGSNGLFVEQTKLSAFTRPSSLVTVADGVYVGRQRDNRFGTPNSRIGYRHSGKAGGTANTAFADGHAKPIAGNEFPRALGGSNDPAEVRAENLFGQPTVYANPEKALSVP